MGLFRKSQPALTREQSLAAVPVRNQAVTASEEASGEICITIPRREAWWVKLLSKMFYVPKHKKMSLDELGSYVWELCDGKNSVRAVIEKFRFRYSLNEKEAELSMVAYLKQLAKKGLIGLLLEEQAAALAREASQNDKPTRRRKKRKRGKR